MASLGLHAGFEFRPRSFTHPDESETSVLYRAHGSGLVLAEHGHDERSMRAQLRAFDRDLVLSVEHNHRWGSLEYVVAHQGSGEIIARWRDPATGKPLPLSSGLIDHLQRLRGDARTPYRDAAEANAAVQAEVNREMRDTADEAAREIEQRSGRLPAFHPSRPLQLARARGRRNGGIVY